MENKIVVHMKDGKVHKGVTHDFSPEAESFYLLPAEGGGIPLSVTIEDMKALFYVKDYIGNRDFVARREFDEVRRSGNRAILTFFDEEQMWGSIPEGSDEGAGFFFYPSDPDDNNIRLFVVRSSLKELRLVE